MEAKMKIEKV
jgi:hypothetical protein